MLADDHYLHPRIRALIAGVVGFLAALLAAWGMVMPTLGLLVQFPLYSPLLRAAMLVKVLSPLLSFFLVGGWVWAVLLMLDLFMFRWRGRAIFRQRQGLKEQASHTTQQPDDGIPWSELFVTSKTTVRGRLMAVPPLFQRDPTLSWHSAHLPVTPLPRTNPVWSALERQEEEEKKLQYGEKDRKESTPSLHVEQGTPPQGSDVSSQEPEGRSQAIVLESIREDILLDKPGEPADRPKPVTLTLLKHMRAWVHADDGTTVEVKLRGGENAIRLIQLAYIAWRKGGPVDRDKMLTYVLSRGKRRDMNTDQLGEVFDAAKRYLRQDLDRAVNELKKNGHPVSEDIDLFSNEPGFYWLHTCCQVVDLEKIEGYYHPIQIARKEGLLNEKLDGSLPAWVVEACQNLIGAYPGDFLQSLLEKFPDEFGAWV